MTTIEYLMLTRNIDAESITREMITQAYIEMTAIWAIFTAIVLVLYCLKLKHDKKKDE